MMVHDTTNCLFVPFATEYMGGDGAKRLFSIPGYEYSWELAAKRATQFV